MNTRVNLSKSAPALYKTILTLDEQVTELATAAGIDERLRNLLLLRASQLNGCAYCLRMHTTDLLAAGETVERMSVLPAWRETSYFDARERAALSLIEAITLISDGQVEDEIYDAARMHLSDDEVSAIGWLGILINSWNRVAITSRYPVGAS